MTGDTCAASRLTALLRKLSYSGKFSPPGPLVRTDRVILIFLIARKTRCTTDPRDPRGNSLSVYRRRCGLCFGGSVPVIARYHAASAWGRALARATSDFS